MKTIYTTLPIYDRLEKQCFQRGKHAGFDTPIPIVTPQYRLPSFQWKDDTDGATDIDTIDLIDLAGNHTHIIDYFVTEPTTHIVGSDVYFVYNGDTLLTLLPVGEYYLKITMVTGDNYTYYSEWFKVDCVYENLIHTWVNDPTPYNPWTTNGTAITTAVSIGAGAHTASSGETFSVRKGESIRVITTFTYGYGVLPTIGLEHSNVVTFDNNGDIHPWLNVITLTSTETEDTKLYIMTSAETNFILSEVLVLRTYSTKYLTINFHNDCDFYNILYHTGFTQTLWFISEAMEQLYPTEEEGIRNGEGQVVRTFARQVKKYVARTKLMPDYMVDVFNRMRLHDFVQMIDLVGDTNTIYNLEVEHEWSPPDKYYAQINLTFDYNEAVIIAGCCNNMT